jgi:mono/diheme cytochrome c family protein
MVPMNSNMNFCIGNTLMLVLVILLASQVSLLGVAAEHDSDALLQHAPVEAQARQNPYADNEEARLAGSKLFRQHCAECHGEDGKGAKDAPSLRTTIVSSAAPGALVWFLKNGNVRRGMPSWSRLPEARLWQIVTHLQYSRDVSK